METAAKQPKLTSRRYELSDRLGDAIDELAERQDMGHSQLLSMGVEILEKDPTRIKLGGLGEDESRLSMTFETAPDELVERINKLADRYGRKRRSVVVRSAIEALIERFKLEEYSKPPGWKSRIYMYASPDNQAVEKLPEQTWTVSVALPYPLWSRIEHLQRGRGHAHEKGMDLSRFVRAAIDAANPKTLHEHIPPEVLIKRQSWLKTQTDPKTLLLFKRQESWLDQQQRKLARRGVDSRQGVIACMIQQAIDLRSVRGVKFPALPKPSKLLAKQWLSFCQSGSIAETAEAFQIDPQELAELFLEYKLIESYRPIDPPKAKQPRIRYTAEDYLTFIGTGANKKTVAETADHFGVAPSTIHARLHAKGIRVRDL